MYIRLLFPKKSKSFDLDVLAAPLPSLLQGKGKPEYSPAVALLVETPQVVTLQLVALVTVVVAVAVAAVAVDRYSTAARLPCCLRNRMAAYSYNIIIG